MFFDLYVVLDFDVGFMNDFCDMGKFEFLVLFEDGYVNIIVME